jgi:hypothetical protein
MSFGYAGIGILTSCVRNNTSACSAAELKSYSSYYATQNATSPFCSQASIESSLCNSIIDGWYNQFFTATSGWPTKSSIAPGCTIGCDQCRVTGKWK